MSETQKLIITTGSGNLIHGLVIALAQNGLRCSLSALDDAVFSPSTELGTIINHNNINNCY